jgi:hypothetical protein
MCFTKFRSFHFRTASNRYQVLVICFCILQSVLNFRFLHMHTLLHNFIFHFCMQSLIWTRNSISISACVFALNIGTFCICACSFNFRFSISVSAYISASTGPHTLEFPIFDYDDALESHSNFYTCTLSHISQFCMCTQIIFRKHACVIKCFLLLDSISSTWSFAPGCPGECSSDTVRAMF